MRSARFLVCVPMALALVLTGSPAHAATTLVADDEPGVYASVDVTFKSAYLVDPINNLRLKDRACDGNSVYVRFFVYIPGGRWETDIRRNEHGCGTTVEWDGLYIHDGRTINGVRIQACVARAGDDACDVSVYVDNPHT